MWWVSQCVVSYIPYNGGSITSVLARDKPLIYHNHATVFKAVWRKASLSCFGCTDFYIHWSEQESNFKGEEVVMGKLTSRLQWS